MSRARTLSPEQVARATTALAGVFSESAGMSAAFEAARNVAQAILGEDAIGECTPTAELIGEFLRGRRARFPHAWTAALTDAGIDSLAARGGAAWATAVRAASGRAA